MSDSNLQLQNDLGLFDFLELLKKERKLLGGVTAFFLIVSLIYVAVADDIYRAELVLSPAERGGVENQQVRQFGQAASFVGLNLDEEDRQIEYALELLRSREFIGEFITSQNMAVPLMAGVWNSAERVTEINSAIYDTQSGEWRGQYSPNGPTDWQLYNKFISILEISESRQGSVVRLALEWHDPVLAAEWANALIDDLNANIKEMDRAEALRAIEYSRDQIDKTQLLEMQRIFYDIIETQTRVVLLADVRDDYVFRVIDRAVVPEEKIAPQRAIIVLSSAVAGLFFGILVVLFVNMFKDGKQRPNRKIS